MNASEYKAGYEAYSLGFMLNDQCHPDFVSGWIDAQLDPILP